MKNGTASGPVGVVNLLYNQGNPYQRMFYSAEDAGVRLVGGPKAMIGNVAAAAPQVVHLHWDDRIFGRGADEAANRAAATAILDDLARYKDGGGRIVWTVHNRIAHAEKDADTFFAARRRLCGLADLIHVHAAHAAAHVADAYDAPGERIRIIPHPSYLGAYEPGEATRARPPAEGPTAFLHFGYIRSNKGVDKVVDAARALNGRPVEPWRLSIIGKAFRSGVRLMRAADGIENVTTSADSAPDEAVPGIFGAAHFYVAPMRELFTSGSLMLAQTFGLPVIGPATTEMRETTAPENHDLLYPSDNHPRRVLRAMIGAIEMKADERAARRAAAFAFAEARNPQRMSRLLGRAICDIVS